MTGADPDKVVQLYDVELLSIRAIAKRLGMSYGAVQRIVSTHTTTRPNGRPGKGNIEALPCGTRKAYQRHINRGEEPDELCKEANREYTRKFNRHTGASRARNRAYRRLARKFPDVFAALLTEEQVRAAGEFPDLAAGVRRTRARERAHRRLVGIYPGTFQLIFEEEKIVAQNEIRQ